MTVGTERSNLRPTVVDPEALHDTFREDVLEGLARPRKAIPPKHLYDARGSELFERICELEEYYPTRTEQAIVDRSIDRIAAALGPEVTLIEPGAGSGEKAAMLLERLERPRAFVPIEISRCALEAAAERLADRFPEVEVRPVCADFLGDAAAVLGAVGRAGPAEGTGRRVVHFPGSTIGNLERAGRAGLLRRFRAMVGPGGMLLLGFDRPKDESVLRRAYDDRAGVTAAFNRNLLARINRELGGTFEPAAFEHAAPWVASRSRIEMHLVSRAAQSVEVAGQAFRFRPGESIHTESSHKLEPAAMDREAVAAGFEPLRHWEDERGWFRVGLYAAAAGRESRRAKSRPAAGAGTRREPRDR